MTSTVERFSNRVENYIKYRPGYPAEVLDLFRTEMGLRESSVIADIGSGTGISSRLFLENGNVVYGVEPNEGMRAAAERTLGNFPNFKSVDGTAENTTLPNASVDFVLAAQAFHWFENDATRKEFERVLRSGGHIVLIWNERQLDTTPFLREYEQLLLAFATDYEKVRHENVTKEKIELLFQRKFSERVFANKQEFGFEGLKGRMLSASYMPSETEPAADAMLEQLQRLFAKYAENDKIEVLYDTRVFYSSN
jgi:ubiquinone/menaquinone biosynthesis C-methylase UbiE